VSLEDLGSREFGNDDEADRAVQTCNGQDFLGRSLVVNEARPMREGGGGGGGRGPGGWRRRRTRRVVHRMDEVAVAAAAENTN